MYHGSDFMPRFCRQPSAAPTVCLGVQSGQLSSEAGTTSKCEALVVDDAEGETGEDWCQGRDPRTVRHVSDGRGGHPPATVQDDLVPDSPTRPAQPRADMTMMTFAEMNSPQNLMESCVSILTNSYYGGLRWLV